VLERVPDSDGVQQLLVALVEEDADRRGGAGVPPPRDGWDDDGWTPAGWTAGHRTTRL
jgi:hypothetical protein